MNNTEREIKIGDWILFTNRCNEWLEKVVKITPTLIKCERTTVSKQYMITTGSDKWDKTTAKLCEESEVKVLRYKWYVKRLAFELNNFDFKTLPESKISSIYEMVFGGTK